MNKATESILIASLSIAINVVLIIINLITVHKEDNRAKVELFLNFFDKTENMLVIEEIFNLQGLNTFNYIRKNTIKVERMLLDLELLLKYYKKSKNIRNTIIQLTLEYLLKNDAFLMLLQKMFQTNHRLPMVEKFYLNINR